MKKIKTFNMVYSLDDGGVQNFSLNLYKYMNHDHIAMDFITKRNKKEFYDPYLKAIGGKKIALCRTKSNNKLLTNMSMFFNAIRVFRDGYELGYFSLKSPADALKYPLLFSITTRKKVIIHAHSSSDEKKGAFHRFLNSLGRRMINRLNYTKFACSDKAAIWMFGQDVFQSNDYILIKNGIEAEEFQYNEQIRNEVRNDFNVAENDYIVVHVGRFTHAKNHEFIIDLFDNIQQDSIDRKLVLYLVGVGEKKESIEKLVKERKLNNVVFLGQRKDVNRILQGADLFILPSIYEGLPIVGIEAQAAGLKCLVSSAVSRELNLTGNVEYLSLDLDLWKKEIYKNASIQHRRDNVIDAIVDNGFNIGSEAVKVEGLIDSIVMK